MQILIKLTGVHWQCNCQHVQNTRYRPIQKEDSMSDNSRQTLPQKAADSIIRLIRTGNYNTEDKLPNEYDLSNMLGVSRNTVREAIKLLVSRNILEVRRGAGTYVSPKMGLSEDPLGLSMISNHSARFLDILELRILVEPRCAALAAQYISNENLKLLKEIYIQLQNNSENGYDYILHSADFHIQIALSSANTIMYNLIKALLPMDDEFIRFYESLISSNLNDHQLIYEAIQNHDSCKAHDMMQAHLIYLKNAFLQANDY